MVSPKLHERLACPHARSYGRHSSASSRSASAWRSAQLDVLLAQHDELVATEPDRRVAVAHRGREPGRHLPQDLVAGVVTEHVVEALEMVEVDEDEADIGAFAAAARQAHARAGR